MDIRTEWNNLKNLLQSFSGKKVGDYELRWAPPEYQTVLDAEFLQLGRVAATLGTESKIIGEIDECWITFGKQVEKGKWEVTTHRPQPEPKKWNITPVEKQSSCFWRVKQLDKSLLSSAQLAEMIKSELIHYHEEFCEHLPHIIN